MPNTVLKFFFFLSGRIVDKALHFILRPENFSIGQTGLKLPIHLSQPP